MITDEISRLKVERGAVVLAHNYQPGQVQEIADLVGDSLELARGASKLDCDVILFAGVDFMAETAKVLSPEKVVLLAGVGATCPMAHMTTAEEVRSLKARHPEAAVACYVNSTAAVKAEADICCTSANVVEVVNSLEEDEVIFVPDRNLAAYVARYTEKKILPGKGYCYVHDHFTAEEVRSSRAAHPQAEVLVHPECRAEVIDLADYVYSTSGMVRHASASGSEEFIIGTEVDMLYRLKKECPDKAFFPLSDKAVCADMKKTNLEKILWALETLKPQVSVPEEVARRAKGAIERMLAI